MKVVTTVSMKMTKPPGCTVLVLIFWLAVACVGEAQFGPLLDPAYAPQAKSEAELDHYLQIIRDSDPQTTVRDVELFSRRFPKSEFLGIAYQYEMTAYQKLGDFRGMLQAGKKALQYEPKNVNTLLAMAQAIPGHLSGSADASSLLGQAEEYANQALQELQNMRIPREIPLAQWRVMQGQMEARAHEALGYIASGKGDLKKSVSQFQMAALHNPTPQGDQFYRLGLAYALSGEKELAQNSLHRAIVLGPDRIRALAKVALEKLQ